MFQTDFRYVQTTTTIKKISEDYLVGIEGYWCTGYVSSFLIKGVGDDPSNDSGDIVFCLIVHLPYVYILNTLYP